MKRVLRFGLAWLAASLLVLAVTQGVAAAPRRVLLIGSFGPHFAPWNAITAQFRDELIKQSPDPIDLYEVSLQLGRYNRPQNEAAFVDYLAALYSEGAPELLVAVGAPAARFVLRNRQKMFPSTPLLIVGTDARTFSEAELGAHDTAVAVNIDAAAQIDAMLQLLPDLAHIAVAIGDSPLERFWVAELRRVFARFDGRVTFHWLNDLPFDEMARRVAALPARSAIYYASVRVDARGALQEDNQSLARLRAVANAPMFSYVDSNLGLGIVGGPLISVDEIARRSTAVALRIFGGEPAGSIKTPTLGLAAPQYDWRELQRWSIREGALPPGSIVRFNPPSILQAYRAELAALIAVLLIQGALIVWLLFEHRRRQRAEVLARNTLSELTHMNRLATAGELSASLAHEVNQPLTGIAARASAGLRWLALEQPDIERTRAALTHIVNASHRASEIVTSVRAMFRKDSAERQPVSINELIVTVLTLLRIELHKHGVEVVTQLDPSLPRVECDRVQVQQMILNLVMNAIEAMHEAPLRTLRIQTGLSKPYLAHLSIEDTGPGIEPDSRERIFRALFTTKSSGMGMGLSICQSIVENHNGRIWAEPGAAGGSVFHVELPTTVAEH